MRWHVKKGKDYTKWHRRFLWIPKIALINGHFEKCKEKWVWLEWVWARHSNIGWWYQTYLTSKNIDGEGTW